MQFTPPYVDELEHDRIWRHSTQLLVYLPPRPKPQPDDWKLDFPPGFPPHVYFGTVAFNYWVALQEGSMPYMYGKHIFTKDEMDWLTSLKPIIEDMITNRK